MLFLQFFLPRVFCVYILHRILQPKITTGQLFCQRFRGREHSERRNLAVSIASIWIASTKNFPVFESAVFDPASEVTNVAKPSFVR